MASNVLRLCLGLVSTALLSMLIVCPGFASVSARSIRSTADAVIQDHILESTDPPQISFFSSAFKITKAKDNSTKEFLSTNVTLSVPQGNITFRDGFLVAVPDSEPTVWTIVRDEPREGFQVRLLDQFERELYWQGKSFDKMDVGTSDWPRFSIQLESSNAGDRIVFFDGRRCLYFNEVGEGVLSWNSACQPINYKTAPTFGWKDPLVA